MGKHRPAAKGKGSQTGKRDPKAPWESIAGKSRKPETHLYNAMAAESNRGCILVGLAFLEYQLEILLRAHFLRVNPENSEAIESVLDPESPHAMFGPGARKATAALLMGLLTPYDHLLLRKIRTIRVNCAHHPGRVLLTGESIRGLVSSLNGDDRKSVEWWIKHEKENPRHRKMHGANSSEPRRRFTHICGLIYSRIMASIHKVLKLPPNERGIVLGRYKIKRDSQKTGDPLPE
jgi:hypothetical protein